ncbi:MAG: heavy metal translocating P-type ATPase [Nostocoides sp.]
MTLHDTHETATDSQVVDLAITGMTCASCSARIERKLGKLEGVAASVNLATEKAHIRYDAPLTVQDILATVRATGYGAEIIPERAPAPPASTPGRDAGHQDGHAAGHVHEDVAPESSLRRRATISAALTLPVFILAMVPGLAEVSGNAWWQFLLATPVVVWAAWPFHRAAAVNARHRASTMDTLVSMGVLAAYLWSAVTVLTGRAGTTMGGMSDSDGHLYFEVATVVTTFLLVGRWLEARAKAQGKSALTTLLDLGAKDVAVESVDPSTGVVSEHRIPIEDLEVGAAFVVRPGEKVATDGLVRSGRSTIDASLVTGESMPLDVAAGDEVTGGTLNGGGRLLVQATRVGADTTLAGIARLVENAQTGKAGVERLADRISAVFVPVVLALAAATFVGWWIGTGSATAALPAAIAVLIIACPCALGLATPTAILVGTGRGAGLGILIKGPQVLEDTRRVDTVVLDKTGTITEGHPTLIDVTPAGRLTKEQALRAAAAVEAGSEHPIASAIVGAARARNLDIPDARDFQALTGSGAVAVIGGEEVFVGRRDLFTTVPTELTPRSDGSTVWLGWGGIARATLTVADAVRADAERGVRDLGELGLTAYLLTGDSAVTAHAVARAVGIPADRVIAEVRPADKHAMIERLQHDGHVVAMVGDGVNDAAALAQADLGVAMGSGTDVAAASADLVLMGDRVTAIAQGIGLSRATLRVIKQNLAWAFGYNIAAIPLAMAGLLNPMIAGAAMAASSVLVVSNSLRLRRYGR